MDPYKVLGVNPGDDEETIKKAYRKLVKKYHPDRYVNTPMADMANEKLKEINEAYDMITNHKTDNTSGHGAGYGSGYGGGYRTGYGGAQYGGSYTVSFESVRMLIRLRRLTEAETMLSQLPKSAEWHYLMGLIYINRGWYDKGKGFLQTAVNMDPQNMEYRQTLNSFDVQNRNYREFRMDNTTCCLPYSLTNCLCFSCLCSRCCC